jgi:DNA-binding XRE family transcriptional regulator
MDNKKRQFLIDLREANGWSQGYVARQIGISQQAVSFHEKGGQIKPDTALKYIDFYNNKITINDFYRQ